MQARARRAKPRLPQKKKQAAAAAVAVARVALISSSVANSLVGACWARRSWGVMGFEDEVALVR
jgi:hypothetical protein